MAVSSSHTGLRYNHSTGKLEMYFKGTLINTLDEKGASTSHNVKAYGAKGDGVTDDTLAVQLAINTAGISGGEVYFPAGNYLVRPLTPEGHSLVVKGNGVTLCGTNRGASTITMRPYSGIEGSNETSWEIIDSKVWRGGGIFVIGGSTALTVRRNITICNLTIDGGCKYTGNVVYPANALTGDGWDITHKGIWLENDKYFDDITIDNVEIFGFKGEIIYGSGAGIGSITLRNSDLHDTNGDCWSVSGRNTVVNNKMHKAAHACIEDRVPDSKFSYYGYNELYDSDTHQLMSIGTPKNNGVSGPTLIEHMYFHHHSGTQSAVYLSNAVNVQLIDSLFIDVALKVNTRAIQLDGVSSQVDVLRNTIRGNEYPVNCGIIVPSDASLSNCRIEDNSVTNAVVSYILPALPPTSVRYARNLSQGVEV